MGDWRRQADMQYNNNMMDGGAPATTTTTTNDDDGTTTTTTPPSSTANKATTSDASPSVTTTSSEVVNKNDTTTTSMDVEESTVKEEDKDLVITTSSGSLPAKTCSTTEAPPPSPTYVLPSCSSWFKLDSINAIEKRMLPEFFTNANASTNTSTAPQVYMQYRNFIVQTYRQDPSTYLNATTCRRSLAGDACAIIRVFDFLNHWGIINYQVNASDKPPPVHFTEEPNFLLQQSMTTPNLTPNLENQKSDWSLDEKSKLLDAVTEACTTNNNNNNTINWDKIANDVKKSRLECISYFLQLQEGGDTTSTTTSTINQKSSVDVITTLLSQVKYPSVAEAASKAASEELKNIYKEGGGGDDVDLVEAIVSEKINAGIVSKTEKDDESLKKEVLVNDVTVPVAAATALASTSTVNALKLLRQKKDEIKDLMVMLNAVELEKVQLKMKEFDIVCESLKAEEEKLMHDRYEVYLEKLQLEKNKLS